MYVGFEGQVDEPWLSHLGYIMDALVTLFLKGQQAVSCKCMYVLCALTKLHFA